MHGNTMEESQLPQNYIHIAACVLIMWKSHFLMKLLRHSYARKDYL